MNHIAENAPPIIEKKISDSSSQKDDRREFVRINETMTLHYRYVDFRRDVGNMVALAREKNSVSSELQEINHQLEPLLLRLQDRPGAMVKALALMNRKLDQLMAVTNRLEKAEQGLSAISTPVTLSANGISFYCDELPAKKNTPIQLSLCLKSIGVYFDCFGKVLRWEEREGEGRHKVAVIFEQLEEQDQEILIQYVVKRQMELHREGSGR